MCPSWFLDCSSLLPGLARQILQEGLRICHFAVHLISKQNTECSSTFWSFWFGKPWMNGVSSPGKPYWLNLEGCAVTPMIELWPCIIMHHPFVALAALEWYFELQTSREFPAQPAPKAPRHPSCQPGSRMLLTKRWSCMAQALGSNCTLGDKWSFPKISMSVGLRDVWWYKMVQTSCQAKFCHDKAAPLALFMKHTSFGTPTWSAVCQRC